MLPKKNLRASFIQPEKQQGNIKIIFLNRESQAFGHARVVKVSSPSSEQLGVADTWWQLEEILDVAKENAHPDLFVLEESEFQLPTMLITNVVMDRVHCAINDHRKTDKHISKCIRFDKMDQHMSGSMNVSMFCVSRTTTIASNVPFLFGLAVCETESFSRYSHRAFRMAAKRLSGRCGSPLL